MQLLRSVYMDGRSSIYNSLPRPVVKMLGGHSYMPLKQIVAHHLAFATFEEVSVFDRLLVNKNDGACSFADGTSLYNSVAGIEKINEGQSRNDFNSTISCACYHTK